FAVPVGDLHADHVAAVVPARQVALEGEGAHQVVRGGHGQVAAPGDLLDGQAAGRPADGFQHAQRPGDATDQVRGLLLRVTHRNTSNPAQSPGLTPYETLIDL